MVEGHAPGTSKDAPLAATLLPFSPRPPEKSFLPLRSLQQCVWNVGAYSAVYSPVAVTGPANKGLPVCEPT